MAPEQEVAELDLRAYLAVLGRQRHVIVGTAALLVVLAVGWSLLQDPSYEARARVLVSVDPSQSLFDPNRPQVANPNRVVQTEALVFESPQLRDEVARRIGAAPPVAALQVEQTDVIEVVATASDARSAATVANTYAEAYIDLRRQQAVDSVVSAAEQLQQKVSELQRQIDTTAGEQQNSLIEQQALFRQKLDQLQVDGALQRGGARLISNAAVPGSPVSPDPLRAGVVAGVFGLLAGVGLALGREYLDDTVRTSEDAQRAVPGLTVMGLIPAVPGWRSPSEALVVSIDAPASPASEAYRTLRTSLAFLSLEHHIGVIQVTSPSVGEGKSTTVANVGVAVARTGRRAVVVDCDLRRPRLHEFFGLDNTAGLTSVLAGEVPLASAVVPVPGVNRLSVLPAGRIAANPSELLASPRTRDLIGSLAADGAVVILDSPPVLPVTDALVISARAHATVVVCRAGRSTGKQLRRCVEVLRRVKAPLAGLVITGAESDASDRAYEASAPAAPRGRERPPPSRASG